MAFASLKGKNILVLGVGSEYRVSFWKDVVEIGVRVHMVDTESHPILCDIVEHFFVLPGIYSHIDSDVVKKRVLKEVRDSNVSVDACVSFTERFLVTAASLCQHWNLPGNSVASVLKTMSKDATMKALKGTGTEKYVPVSALVRSLGELESFMHGVPFPILMKPDGGMYSMGVKRIQNRQEALDYLGELQTRLDGTSGDIGSYLGFTSGVVAMEFVEGPLLDITVFLSNGDFLGGMVFGNGPKRQPGSFACTTQWSPSMLDRNQENKLLKIAYQVSIDLGLTHGTFCCDIVAAETGPKLLEVNPRPSGIPLCEWPSSTDGHHVLYTALMLACNVLPLTIPGSFNEEVQKQNLFRVNYCVSADRHQRALTSVATLEKLKRRCKDRGNVTCEVLRLSNDSSVRCFEIFAAVITSEAENPRDARENLLSVLEELNLEPDDEGRSIRSLLF